jgi:CheY-like chemotaxis protein
MNGLESTREIRKIEVKEQRRPCMIVGLSGNARNAQVEEALDTGMVRQFQFEYLYSLLHRTFT